MFDAKAMLFIYTETPLHCGSGISLGPVDLPIQREKSTNYPMVQASSIKGVVRDEVERKHQGNSTEEEKIKVVFGPEDAKYAGAISLTDGKILLFPVRSLKGVFGWITSRDVLERFKRDLEVVGITASWNISAESGNKAFISPGSNLIVDPGSDPKHIVLEEFDFEVEESDDVKNITKWISEKVVPNTPSYAYWRDKLQKDIALLPNDDFKDFVEIATEVIARIKLKPSKTVEEGGLWDEEYLPSDTILYSIMLASKPRKNVAELTSAPDVINYIKRQNLDRLQLGGDETVGKGIIKVILTS